MPANCNLDIEFQRTDFFADTSLCTMYMHPEAYTFLVVPGCFYAEETRQWIHKCLFLCFLEIKIIDVFLSSCLVNLKCIELLSVDIKFTIDKFLDESAFHLCPETSISDYCSLLLCLRFERVEVRLWKLLKDYFWEKCLQYFTEVSFLFSWKCITFEVWRTEIALYMLFFQ